MLGMAEKERRKVLVGIILVIILAFIASIVTGCAFYHRGESAFGFLNDVQMNQKTESSAQIQRPARD